MTTHETTMTSDKIIEAILDVADKVSAVPIRECTFLLNTCPKCNQTELALMLLKAQTARITEELCSLVDKIAQCE